MNEQEIVKAVTAKLTGEFYVGQRVRYNARYTRFVVTGKVEHITLNGWYDVRMDADFDGRRWLRSFRAKELVPA